MTKTIYDMYTYYMQRYVVIIGSRGASERVVRVTSRGGRERLLVTGACIMIIIIIITQYYIIFSHRTLAA